jgi:hypothetical protein
MTMNMWATLKNDGDNTGDSHLYFRNGVTNTAPWGSEWIRSTVEMPEIIEQVSCGYRGYVWAVGESGKVYRLKGVTADRPQGISWTELNRGGMAHISIGDEGDVWGNDFNGNVFQVENPMEENPDQLVWNEIEGSLVQLDSGYKRVIGVNNWGEIFERNLQGA